MTETVIDGLCVLHVPAWELDWSEGQVRQGVGSSNGKRTIRKWGWVDGKMIGGNSGK